ncbi:PAS domain S-box-containing protein [Archangium gephyra]|uniref:histidine kinase n=1 Tax=Archangium gephyra TaxID=48 RepID=A0AAC8QIR4_9BACT|nr:PAS domain S-box protein [Archangium gephyra]AKJ08452.1 Chemotaxis protein methyltransferase CheR [Archangium gephyra]REG20548.1 PAS domain S-box-containing protein [Archangium gephyra]
MKLPFKSLVFLLLLLGAVFTVGLVAFYSMTRQRLEDEALLRQLLRAKELAYQLKPGISYTGHVAESAAAVVAPVRDAAELERLLQALLTSAPTEAIHGLGVWFEHPVLAGRAPGFAPYVHRAGSGKEPVSVTDARATQPGEPQGQSWYQRALEARGAPVFPEPHPVEGSIYRVHARALLDASGEPVGVIAVDVSIPHLHGILQGANAPGGEELLYVTTPGGRLFAHPAQEPLLAWVRERGRPVASLGELSLPDARHYEAERTPGPRRTAQVEIGESGWTVHISSAESSLFASIERFRLALLLLGVAVWAVLLAVPFLLHRTVRVRELSFALEERRRLHEVLARSERRLREVLETSLDAVISVDCQQRITEWNTQAERLLGWTKEEAVGRPAFELLLGPELRPLLERDGVVTRRQRICATVRRQDGGVLPVELSTTVVQSGGMSVRYIFMADITERQRAEEERNRLLAQLQQRGAELQATIDNMVDSVVVSDRTGRITFVNKAGRQLFGEVGTEGVQLTDGDLELHGVQLGGRRAARLEEMPLYQALRGNVVVDADLSFPSAERRRTLHLRTNAAPIRDEQGHITGAVSVARDVTEMVELDHLKDEFVRVAAHELKTPVAIMKSYAQLALKAEPTPATYRKMLDAINRGADRIDRIVRELLDVSQLHLGQLKLTEEPLDLRELAEETVANMAAQGTQHRFSVQPGGAVIIRGDRGRLRQVLVVLLDNAVRYSPSGGRVEVRLSPHEHEVEVCVSDEGIGIPAERQARLFERFYRAHSGTPHDRGGMGVGLYISREIIFHHGGSMRVSSEEGRGSTFCFSVPYAPQREERELHS